MTRLCRDIYKLLLQPYWGANHDQDVTPIAHARGQDMVGDASQTSSAHTTQTSLVVTHHSQAVSAGSSQLAHQPSRASRPCLHVI